MLKIFFFIRTAKARQNGECPLYCRINFNRKLINISTGKYITEEHWKQTDKLRRLVRQDREKVLKESLDLFTLKIEKLYNSIQKQESSVTAQEFKLMILGKDPKEKIPELIELIGIHNTYFSKLVKIGERASSTLQKYERVKGLVIQFNRKYFGVDIIEISKINGAYIYNLESYLKFESVCKGQKGIKNNSVVKYFKNLKTICNYGIKMDIIDKNPFNRYTGKLNSTEATFLTHEELHIIQNKTFTEERLELVKDIFLFSCYTGYAPVDVIKLTKSNIIRDANQDFWIKTNRQKTGTKSNVPLLPQAQKIIEKYDYLESRLLPYMYNQKMNIALKEIASIIGLSKILTWYVARHTFATTVTLGNGLKIENVSTMMGHSTIKQTQHYAKVLDSSVSEDMNKLKKRYSKS